MLDVIGLPTGFTWACNPSNCKYPGDSIGCLIITGTPSQNQIGEYPLTIPVNANITEKTLKLTFNQPDTITMYSLFVKNGSTSIRETEQNQIVFFPNPAKGNFVITINNNKIEEKEIEIMDIRGKVLFNTVITSSGNQHLTVSDLSDGIYFLSIKNGTHRRTEKLVIIN